MNIEYVGHQEVECEGSCPYEPLNINGGTLADGTTYTFSTPSTLIDLGQGTIEHGSSEDLVVTFSGPVDLQFTNAAAPSTRGVWHGNSSGSLRSKATTDGSTWCYTPGSDPADIIVTGTEAIAAIGASSKDANDDWGTLETYGATQVTMFAYVFDAYNYEARPSVNSASCTQPVCDVIDDIQNKLKVALTPDTPVVHEVATGPFTRVNTQSSWWDEGWTPVITANQATSTHYDWQDIGIGSVTSPDVITDLTVTMDPGSWYTRVRRARFNSWLDIRILVNGAAVYTLSNASYYYDDARDDTNPDVIKPIPTNYDNIFSTVVAQRLSVPASATVQAQVRWRYNVSSAQASAYVRVIGGLRSRAKFDFFPKTIITGVS